MGGGGAPLHYARSGHRGIMRGGGVRKYPKWPYKTIWNVQCVATETKHLCYLFEEIIVSLRTK